MTRLGRALFVVALIAAGCSADSDPVADPDDVGIGDAAPDERVVDVIGGRFHYPGDPVNGVATAIRPLTSDEYFDRYGEPVDRPVPLAFAARACRDHGGLRVTYDIQWRPPDDVELPVTVGLSVGPATGYSYFLGIGLYEVELAEPGTFRIEQLIDPSFVRSTEAGESQLSVTSRQASRECRLQVGSERYIDDQGAPDLKATIADDLVSVDAPDGSLQWLAGSAHVIAPVIERLLLDAPSDFEWMPDRIWLAPDLVPDSISITERFGCWRVRSSWFDEDLRVVQSRGCEIGTSRARQDQRSVMIEDPSWRVEVIGLPDRVEQFIANVRPLPVAGITALAEGQLDHDALASFEAARAADESTEVARLPWQDGVVVVWSYDDEIDLRDLNVSAFDENGEFGFGGGGTPIQSGICATSYASGTPDKGFALVWFDDPLIDRVEVQRLDGSWDLVEIVDAGSIRIGLTAADVRSDETFQANAPPIRGFDAAGGQLPCVRNG